LIKEIRKKYNSQFTEEKYSAFVESLNTAANYKIEFRIGETPIFLPHDFKIELMKASEDVLNYLQSPEFKITSANAIPPGMEVPCEDAHPAFLALDFAICKGEDGKFIPQLIELQGFPSLYCYQELLNLKFREHFEIPPGFTNFFNELDHDSYFEVLKETIIGNSNPENVILLEIEPEKQKTKIDFTCTEKWIGIKTVCISDIIKEDKCLYYINEGKKTRIERIYNRVIFDELQKRDDIKYNFSFQDELDVKWLPHPNWFFKISKHTLPALKSRYVPETYFLSQLKEYPSDLENYVLKPLYSFAGVGVKYDVTKEDLDGIENKDSYILQRKIQYADIIETPDIPAKAELRLLYVWNDKPMLINNLVRLSKGKMMGVDYNKDKTWVGSSIAYFEES